MLVGAGVYKPEGSAEDARANSFIVHAGVTVYGGFPPAGGRADDRDAAFHPTILSGDLLGNDSTAVNGIDLSVPTDGSNTDNSYHVVTINDGLQGIAVDRNTVLDGLIITAGNARTHGGGLYCAAAQAQGTCSPTLSNLTFIGNHAEKHGGAMLTWAHDSGLASPLLSKVLFVNNSAGEDGGALYSWGGWNDGTSAPVVHNATFADNQADGAGGAIAGAGPNGETHVTLENVTITGNMAKWGGAIYSTNAPAKAATVSLSNVIVWENQAGQIGDAMYLHNNSTSIDHSIIAGGDASIHGATGTPFASGTGNLDADPELGPLMYTVGANKARVPGHNGAALDNGTCVLHTDQREEIRPDTGCDIGAVESRGPFDGDIIFFDNFEALQ